MKITDIVNRGLVNLDNCEQEPIHVPGSIQPHGFLLALNSSHLVEYCSGNLRSFLQLGPEQVLQQHLNLVVGKEQGESLVRYIGNRATTVIAPHVVSINDRLYQCAVHPSGNLIICEFEPISESVPAVATVYDQAIHFAGYMEAALTLQQLCQNVVTEIRSLTGYDRVMVYRFDKDYNGEVFAEARALHLEPFLGLHYPHTDIPVQARQLYLKNLLRIIADVNYEPVPVYTYRSASNTDLDLGQASLRSVSPIHIQYLNNMGVGATLTISLIHEGRLWGLIACHHYSAKYIDHYTRINAQLQGLFLTSQINVREKAEHYSYSMRINQTLTALLNKSYPAEGSSLQSMANDAGILEIAGAAGVAILLNGTIYKSGITPPDELIVSMAEKAEGSSRGGVFYTNDVNSLLFGEEQAPGAMPGLLYYQLAMNGASSIMWFRTETLEEISWGGDPKKAIVKDANGLSPRKSFEKYKEIIRNKSKEWSETALAATSTFSYAVQKLVTLVLLTEEEKRKQILTNKLIETNLELENINWISTHDLKEPLRKIQLFSSKLLENADAIPAGSIVSVERIHASAGRMQKLIHAITNYAKLRETTGLSEPVKLADIIAHTREELEEEMREHEAAIIGQNLRTIYGVPVLVMQLFYNIIANSLKFSKEGRPQVITITQHEEPVASPAPHDDSLYTKITIADNGIGFDNEHNLKIFNVFSRLHAYEDYEGTGIGLAICKKIMQIHKGHIAAEGLPGEGATFLLYFPLPAAV